MAGRSDTRCRPPPTGNPLFQEVFPISEPHVLDAYCKNLVTVKLSSHRPQQRQSRAITQFKDFSTKELGGGCQIKTRKIMYCLEFTEEQWRILLGDKFELKCSADEFVPRRRNQLRNYPEMTCHHVSRPRCHRYPRFQLCRACFRNSLPVCLRRNPDNE